MSKTEKQTWGAMLAVIVGAGLIGWRIVESGGWRGGTDAPTYGLAGIGTVLLCLAVVGIAASVTARGERPDERDRAVLRRGEIVRSTLYRAVFVFAIWSLEQHGATEYANVAFLFFALTELAALAAVAIGYRRVG